MKNINLIIGLFISVNVFSQEIVSTEVTSTKDVFDFELTERESNYFIKSNAKVSKMGIQINTPFHEMGPILSPDGKTLYFSRYNHTTKDGYSEDEEDIWFSKRDEINGGWSEPKKFNEPFNNSFPNYVDAVASDGNTLLLGNVYLEDGSMSHGLSVSRKLNNEWSFPQELNVKALKRFTEWTGCFLSNDEKVLVMSCSKKSSLRLNSELYVSFRIKENEYTKPVNMGKVINSKFNELSPFLSKDGNTIFFSSNREGGNGGYDIYYSNRLDETYLNWSPLKNLGDKVNTSNNECFFSISNFDNSMFFVSESDNGDLDVYTIESGMPNAIVEINSKIEKNIPSEKESSVMNSNIYNCVNEDLDQMMVPIEFSFNCSAVNSNYEITILSIVSLMEEYPASNVLLTGHSDSIGSTSYNEKLSMERASTIEQHLINYGVSKERIFKFGMGELYPKFSNSTSTGRSKNRRVELTFFN